jgi:uncharacterized protein YeaO (DUF488 family)
MFDEHCPQLAPSQTMLAQYYRDRLRWDKFAQSFGNFMSKDWVEACLSDIAQQALEYDVNLVAMDPQPDHCYRQLIALRCQLLLPELEVVIE